MISRETAASACRQPVRVRFLPDRASQELRAELGSPTGGAPKVGFLSVEASACDLLLCRCALRAALAQLLASESPVAAQTVLLIGHGEALAQRGSPLLAALHAETQAALIGWLDVPDPLLRPWFERLLHELAGGQAVEPALRATGRQLDLPPPCFCSNGSTSLAGPRHPAPPSRPEGRLREVNGAAFTYYSRLQRVFDHVAEHFASAISVRDVARVANLEEKYFSAYFHAKTGVCFRDWLAGLRVRRAVEMMQRHDESITTIAFAVGFNDLRTFERAFKKHTRMTPWGFRRSIRPEGGPEV